MEGLQSIDRWRRELGLHPVPLYSAVDDVRQFILLNGLHGSFCLDLDTADDVDARSIAWSSNVAHYVRLEGTAVSVQRWDQPGLQRAPAAAVASALQTFHARLEAQQPDSSRSSVAHAIRVFRALRGALPPALDGSQALGAYLALLACAFDRVAPRELDAARWALGPEAVDAAERVQPQHWRTLTEDLTMGRAVERLSLDLALLIRHAGGTLFQEAHYEAVVHGQLGLFAPTPARLVRSSAPLGVHFTPPPLVRTLVEEGLRLVPLNRPDITVFDPACGSGEFLREALRQLRSMGYRGPVRLLGWDISPVACAMARFALACESDVGAVVDIQRTDSALTEWPERLDCILMNPPFLAWPDVPGPYKEAMQGRLGRMYAFRPDLASLFVAKAVERLPDLAVLASVLPASFLDSKSMRAFRDELATKIEVASVARLGSHDLFSGAKVDAGFIVARARPTPRIDAAPGERVQDETLVVWANALPTSTSAALRGVRKMRLGPRAAFGQLSTHNYSVYYRSLDSTSWAPRPYDAWQLDQRLGSLPTVADRFAVQQGTLTGLNRAFVIGADEWQNLPLGERPFFRAAVLNESIDAGRIMTAAYVFYPYGDCLIESEAKLRRVVPEFYRGWLRPHEADLKARAGVPERWWDLTRPRRWQMSRTPKLVSTYFGDVGSFALDESGEVIVVQGYGWLGRRAMSFSRGVWCAYLALVNSGVFSTLLSARSNHVGGGQWNLSKRFVDGIPLPDLSSSDLDVSLLKGLTTIGRAIHTRGLESLSAQERREWEQLVEAAYGLSALA